MTIFYILIAVVATGLGFVVWLLIKEKNSSDGTAVEEIFPEQLAITPIALSQRSSQPSQDDKIGNPKGTPSLLTRLRLFTRKGNVRTSEEQHTSSRELQTGLQQLFHKVKSRQKDYKIENQIEKIEKFNSWEGRHTIPQADQETHHKTILEKPATEKKTTPAITSPLTRETDSLRITPASQKELSLSSGLSSPNEKELEKQIESSLALDELKEKYDRTEKILKERNEELKKIQEALTNESRNRKDFNKIKDLLDKEISDTKDSLRKVSVELSAAKAENEIYKNRINQLEQKITKLEKIIIEKDEKIDELTKSAQGSSAPSTSMDVIPSQETLTEKNEARHERGEDAATTVTFAEEAPENRHQSEITQNNDRLETTEKLDMPIPLQQSSPEDFLSLRPDITEMSSHSTEAAIPPPAETTSSEELLNKDSLPAADKETKEKDQSP